MDDNSLLFFKCHCVLTEIVNEWKLDEQKIILMFQNIKNKKKLVINLGQVTDQ